MAKDDAYIFLAIAAALMGMGGDRSVIIPSITPSITPINGGEAPIITPGPTPGPIEYAGPTPLPDIIITPAVIHPGTTTQDAPVMVEGVVTWPKPIWEEPMIGNILAQDKPTDIGQEFIPEAIAARAAAQVISPVIEAPTLKPSPDWSGPYTALDPYIDQPYYAGLKQYYGSLPDITRHQAQEAIWAYVSAPHMY